MTNESTPVNPLLARVKLPGETFAIPSGGIFYENGELDDSVENGELHVYPMAAYDEVLIKTPSLLLNGEAVDKVFRRCVPQIKKPMDLFAKDVDFILMALRQVTYGKFASVNYTHDCENAKNHSYQVDISKLIRESKKINPATAVKDYKFELENGQTINLRPAKYSDIVKIMQSYTLGAKESDGDDPQADIRAATREAQNLIESVLSIIHSVESDGEIISDKQMIREWLSMMSANMIQKITDSVEKTSNWGPVNEHATKCKDCKKQIKLIVPINPISFFT